MAMDHDNRPPPDWYPDPWRSGQLRYWDGASWTPHSATRNSEGPSPVVILGDSHGEPDEPGWRDLALNQPGQAARAKALELRQRRPFLTRLTRLLGVKTEERNWRVGAEGEEEVARRLRRLGQGWYVLHAVPVGDRGTDIDHVVIGPSGVFVLNTKNHTGHSVWVAERAFLVNGQKTDYLRKSRHEASRASRLLSAGCGFPVEARAVIVVLAARLTVKQQPQGIGVVKRRQIVTWLSKQPLVLQPEAVECIYTIARRDTTWLPAGGSNQQRGAGSAPAGFRS
jgi:Nuclease-related domain/Protein of unknown function (DUF2510)